MSDTREAKLAEAKEWARDFVRHEGWGASNVAALLSEISRLESERSELQVEKVALERALVRLRLLIDDGAHAMTFQSLGHYRTALLRAIDRAPEPA